MFHKETCSLASLPLPLPRSPASLAHHLGPCSGNR